MLILTRIVGEKILIGENIRIIVVQVGGSKTRVDIEAPVGL